MDTIPAPRPAGPGAPFGALLRVWRQRRRLSQLHLALDAEVSQRHLSFVESGRAAPSREMVLRLAERLSAPPRRDTDVRPRAPHRALQGARQG